MIIFVNWISTHLLWSPEALQEGFQKQGSIFLFVFFEKAMDIEIVIMSHTWREVSHEIHFILGVRVTNFIWNDLFVIWLDTFFSKKKIIRGIHDSIVAVHA